MNDCVSICLAWAATFFGLTFGIALCIWAYNAHHIDPQVICIQQRGAWVWNSTSENYTCNFGASK